MFVMVICNHGKYFSVVWVRGRNEILQSLVYMAIVQSRWMEICCLVIILMNCIFDLHSNLAVLYIQWYVITIINGVHSKHTGVNLNPERVHWGQTPFQVNADQEIS